MLQVDATGINQPTNHSNELSRVKTWSYSRSRTRVEYFVSLRRVYSVSIYNIVACRDPLLANDCETNNETTQLLGNGFLLNGNLTATEERCFQRGPCRDVASKTTGSMSQLY
jgi:hypothetical protein